MTKYELIYFDLKGRGEAERLAFVIAGIPFTDTRIKGADWPQLKSQFAFGTVPVLRIDDTLEVTQAVAILNYIGRLGGLVPTDLIEALKVDEIIHALIDSGYAVSTSMGIKDQEKKLAVRKELAETTLPITLAGVDKLIAANHGKFAVGDKLTIADLQILSSYTQLTSGSLDGIPVSIVDAYPNFVRVAKEVLNHEAVKRYYEERK